MGGRGLPLGLLKVLTALQVRCHFSQTIDIAEARLAEFALPIASLPRPLRCFCLLLLLKKKAEIFAWIQKSGHAEGGIASAWIHDSRAYDNASLLLGQRLAYGLCARDMCKLAGPMGASKTACGVNCPEKPPQASRIR